MPLISGIRSSDAIAKAMRRYQQAKKQYRKTGIKTWKIDREYWKQRTLAAGAMSIMAAGYPPAWLGGPDHPIWKRRQEKAQRKVNEMNSKSLPYHGARD